MKKSLWLLISICGFCLLSACGSGGTTTTPPPPPATHLSVTAPATATAGTAFSITVTALDASNSVVASYAGTVHFTSTDSQTVLPGNSMLTNGAGTFSVTFNNSGGQTITGTDTVAPTITGVSNTIQVSSNMPVGTFTITGSMEFARAGQTATWLQDGTVLIAGGENSTGPLDTAEIFNPATAMFAATGKMGTPRVGHTATLLSDGTVLVTGGNDTAGALATAEIFNPSSGTFTPTTGNMETARVGHTATLLNDGSGRVLVAGGGSTPAVLLGPVTDTGTASTELFDPTSGQFTTAGSMLGSRIYHTATLLSDGEVLLAGGTNNVDGTALGDLFSPASASFTATATGGTQAFQLSAALLQDGRVLLTGGEGFASTCSQGGSQVSIANALLFETSDASFTETADMSAARVMHSETLLPGGDVLIAGDAVTTTECRDDLPHTMYRPLASAELFSPAASGTFALTGSMSTPRAGHTATLLSNGKVVVVGGIDNNGNFLSSAELFQ
jgi:hypothetical protein